MKLRHVAALPLVGWYLMLPPLPHLSVPAGRVGPELPLARWTIVGTFPTQKECDAHRSGRWQRCISSDDPRLKEKSR
jgi:hypothetical protein